MTDRTMKFWDLVSDVGTCMMVTFSASDGEPELVARPMQAIPDPDNKRILFFTEMENDKSQDLAHAGTVCLTFSKPERHEFVSASGRARLERDAELKRAWWPHADARWVDDGPESERVALVVVDLEGGAFWNSDTSKVVDAVMMAASADPARRPASKDHAVIEFA